MILTALVPLWLTLIVFVPSMLRIKLTGSVVIVQGATGEGDGDGLGEGDGDGVGVGVGVGAPPPRSGVGVGSGSSSLIGVGVGSGSPPSISGGVGVGVAIASAGVGVGAVPEARSPTRRLTFGTESSNTPLSIVMSPEPVTSTDTESEPFFNVIET